MSDTSTALFETAALRDLESEVRRVGRVASALSVMGWDQETHMPPGGAASRARAIGELTEVVHRMATTSRLGELLSAAEAEVDGDGDERARAFLREVRRSYDRRRRIPPDLAEEIARTSSEALQAWKQARADDDFPAFAPILEKLIGLKKQEAEAHGYEDHVYDALLEDYEPGLKSAEVQALCDAVRPTIQELVGQNAPRSSEVRADFLGGYPIPVQQAFCLEVVGALGFDLTRGRVDTSSHPFCSGFSPGDVRLTARYSETFLPQGLYGLIHEAGHGLYEQGLDADWEGTPLGSAVSMGIHESQSRLWENMVGRSREFWQHFLPRLRAHVSAPADDVGPEDFFRAVNRVEPSLIRVEADEVTYNLHIMLRFELEKALFEDALSVAELPGAWNEKMQEFLGLSPPRDADGVLQDIHWSFGGFGYFPTYFLGNLYAAQFYAAARERLGELDAQIAAGDFEPLREWLRTEIHQHGSRYRAAELCRRVTGRPLDPRFLCEYLGERMRQAFGEE